MIIFLFTVGYCSFFYNFLSNQMHKVDSRVLAEVRLYTPASTHVLRMEKSKSLTLRAHDLHVWRKCAKFIYFLWQVRI